MVVTSAAIPPAAVVHALRGRRRWRAAEPWPVRPRAVLFDRDGTLVHDVPYNGDPRRVAPIEGAGRAVRRLRAAGLRLGVVTNQSGIGSGRITAAQADAVNAAVDARVGPLDTWQVCPHAATDGCTCRKPAPTLVTRAARALRVAPYECVVVGDIGSDVEAAVRAGARPVLVPTASTRPEEVAAAPIVVADLAAAADHVLQVLS
jgi:HAD superfamily hydrolase (TIGR01662 family)